MVFRIDDSLICKTCQYCLVARRSRITLQIVYTFLTRHDVIKMRTIFCDDNDDPECVHHRYRRCRRVNVMYFWTKRNNISEISKVQRAILL